MVQNRCSFHGLWSEDPNQHLKDFLKLVDSLDLDGANRERTRLHFIQFSLRGQASNWLERLPVGSISTWEDLTTYFLAQFFPPRRTSKLCNNIMMFQQHQGESLSKAWTRFKDLLKKSLIMESTFGFKSKYFMTMLLPQQDEPLTNRLVNKITSSCEICSGPHDTQYCMENPEQAFVKYASSRTDEAEGLMFTFMASQDAILSKFKADFKQQQSKMTNKIDMVLKAITDRIVGALSSDTVKNSKVNVNSTSPVLSARPSTHDEEREIEWLDVEEPLDLVDRGEESVYESLIKEMPKCSLNFDFRIKKGNFTYVTDFMVEDISSIIDPSLSQVYNSLSDLEKEHTNSVYLRNEEDKRRGVEYVMSKILGFYKDTIKLGPEYVIGIADEGEVTKFFKENEKKILLEAGDGVRIYLDGVEKLICLRTSKSQVYGYLMRYLAFGWHLEEKHMTWAHLEKKRTRLQTYTKSLEELCSQSVETTSQA
ncbi:MAK10-like protein [Tanacetum coccineum]|uniref:MAK10-like protein n=1 Tax=Tanacetum coccineum TaxID=301880 RepID=A0ABQ5EVU2_9ASTR